MKFLKFIIAIALIAGSFFAGQKANPANIKPDITVVQTGIEERIEKIGELASIEYSYTNADKFTDKKTYADFDIPFTTKGFVIRYDGVIKAGIDVSEIKVKVSKDDKKIYVTMPKAKILSHQIDEDSLEVLDENNSLFNKIKIEDYNIFQSTLNKSMEERAVSKGLLDQATESAKEIIELTVSNVKGTDGYKIIFK